MNDQERYRVLDATVKLYEKEGRPISGRELLNFYATTTGDTIEKPQFDQKLRELEREGYLTAKFMEENNGSLADVQYIVVTGDGNKLVVNKEASQAIPETVTDFEKDKKRFLNQIWNWIPSKLKPIILIGLIVLGVVKIIPYFSEFRSNHTASLVSQQEYNPKNDKLIAQEIWAETVSNIETLKEQSESIGKISFRKKPVHFLYDAYQRNAGHMSRFKAAQQIINFYANLKRIEGGTVYGQQMLKETIGQGTDVVNMLQREHSFGSYFQGLDSAKHVVSADLTIVASPPFESVGDFSEAKSK